MTCYSRAEYEFVLQCDNTVHIYDLFHGLKNKQFISLFYKSFPCDMGRCRNIYSYWSVLQHRWVEMCTL